MNESYKKFEKNLVDIKVTNEIRTFNKHDLDMYLKNNQSTSKKEVRKFIRKKINENYIIEELWYECKFDKIASLDERSKIVSTSKLNKFIEDKDKIKKESQIIINISENIRSNNMEQFLIENDLFINNGKIKNQIIDINLKDIYSVGTTISSFVEYVKALSECINPLICVYDGKYYIPYVEEEEKAVYQHKNLINNYNLLYDLEKIDDDVNSINEFVIKKYQLSDEEYTSYNKRCKNHDYILYTKDNVLKKIEDSLFTVEHASLLRGYTQNELNMYKEKIINLVKCYNAREIDYNIIIEKLSQIREKLNEVINGFKLINQIACDYLPKIKEENYSLIEDVNSYYNFSLKKNIERRNGTFGFSKEITQEEVEWMIELIEDKLYVLTNDQRKAISKGAELLNSSYTTNCLLQGDVSSGKTIVSVALMFILAKKGYRSAYVVPRSSLRIQHLGTLNKYNDLFGLNLKIMDAKSNENISNSDILLNGYSFKDHKFNNVKIDVAFVDEIQLLGVKQRGSIQGKYEDIDMFYTTATPHPRTKTISLIGNMDVIEIRELPPGRKPKITKTFETSSDLLCLESKTIESVWDKNEMMIVVCPLVNKKAADFGNVHITYDLLKERYPNRNVIKLLAGEDNINSKSTPNISLMDEKLKACSEGNVDILVTTKIIEVGVDIPCASIMVIAHADKGFGHGVSTLHQLRGRVGRANQQAYCFVQRPNGYEEGSATDTILKTEDVFEITEKDLDWRGIDKIIGLNQTSKDSSQNKNIKKLIEEYKYIAESVRNAVTMLNDEMFKQLCNEVDVEQKVKDLN